LKKENSAIVFEKMVPTQHNELVDFWAEIYSKKYKIPREILNGVLYRESTWELDNEDYYAFKKGDYRNGVPYSFGPAQVQLATAKSVWKDHDTVKVTKKKLTYNVRFNIETSCKLLRILYDEMSQKYKKDKDRWLAALTIYNMGHGKFVKNNRRYNSYAKHIYNSYLKG